MTKFCAFLVDRRKPVFFTILLLALLGLFLLPQVKVNIDMTKYLPDDSPMKQGLDILGEEFSGLEAPNTMRVMFKNIPEDSEPEVASLLEAVPHAESLTHIPGDIRYEKDGYSLYVLGFSCGYFSREMKEAESYVRSHFSGRYDMVYCLDITTQQGVPMWILLTAVLILLVILIIMCSSFAEPFLFLFAMGVAVLINTETDAFLPSVSETTFSIAAVLQLALSIDYSVILMGRYRNELALLPSPASREEKEGAMKRALAGAFSSIAGSALTTVVGLLTLVFMSFKIGADLGIVMAKGVFLSMFCVLTMLPALILFGNPLIEKTAKKEFSLRLDRLGAFSFRHRKVILCAFVLFFAAAFILKGSTDIAFTLVAPNKVDPVFPRENQIIVLYDNQDEEAVASLVPEIEASEHTVSVFAWSNTLGKAFTAEELSEFVSSFDMGFELSPTLVRMIYTAFADGGASGRLTIGELLEAVTGNVSANPLLSGLISADMKKALEDAPAMLLEYEKQLKGPEHSLMAITTTLPGESPDTEAFIRRLDTALSEGTSSPYYLIGNSPMAYEMVESFSGEMNFLTLLTAAAIFLIVLLTFRSISIPFILILLIQSAVYATMVMINLQGMSIYYIALLVVQSMLMGACIDYAIVFTTHYRESRLSMETQPALIAAYNHSIHTILTSGLILVIVTAVLGFAFEDPSAGQIVHTISKGSACALVLVLFILPGVLAALDRFVCPRKRSGDNG